MRFPSFPLRLSMPRTTALVALACFVGVAPGQDAGLSGLARAEMERRAQAAAEAEQLLIQGDKSYNAGRYAEAVEAYRGAVDLLPENSPAHASVSRILKSVADAVNECRGVVPSDKLGSELADIVLRTADLAEWMGIDLSDEIAAKMALNERRGTRGRLV